MVQYLARPARVTGPHAATGLVGTAVWVNGVGGEVGASQQSVGVDWEQLPKLVVSVRAHNSESLSLLRKITGKRYIEML